MNSLVSILIPAYNAERWIAQTIESAINQTYEQKEVIVLDDGSSDRTFDIAKEYEIFGVVVKRQINSGASTARNNLYKLSKGNFIQWLDADDLLHKDKVKEQMKIAMKSNDPFTLFSGSYGEFFYRNKKAKFINNSLSQDLNPINWVLNKFNQNEWTNPAVWLVSRELTEKAGPWDERLSLDDDGEYFNRLVLNSNFVKFVETAKVYYRRANNQSISRTKDEKACESLLLSLKLSFDSLLKLENSLRTKSACVNYLNVWVIYFYPEKAQMLHEIENMANFLCGNIKIPKLSKKYYIVNKLFGFKFSKKLSFILPQCRVFFVQELDKLLYSLNRNKV